MLRRVTPAALGIESLYEQRRYIRYSNVQETLNPSVGGGSAGQYAMQNEIAANPDGEEERRKPTFRREVFPRSRATSYLSGMYRWGYNSLTLFAKVNEDPGPWWNANSTNFVSTHTQIGCNVAMGMWSGIERYTLGLGNYNIRPFEARGRTWGRADRKAKAVTVDYDDQLAATPGHKLTFPHTKEHQAHQRIKNPPLPGFTDVDPLHGKRLLREVQYHIGHSIRHYLIDGVFGSHAASATPFRILTDNPTSAYFASMAAIRKAGYVSREETLLIKRVSQSPLEEWAWRRPGVLIYHAPGYEFEAPRIVEEFGGPRPQDLSLTTPKFIALEPYSIPMKALIAAEPSCETLLHTTAFLCARWGFYADNRGLLTLRGDALLNATADGATVVVGAASDALRSSKYLFGAHHLRLDKEYLSRAWDVTSIDSTSTAAAVGPMDLVESSVKRIQKPLTTRLGNDKALSHRFFGRRRVTEFGYKRPHNYTDDVATRADQGGHLFNGASKNQVQSNNPVRPNAIGLGSVNIVVVGDKPSATVADAVAVVVDQMAKAGFLYAESDKLSSALTSAFSKVKSVKVVDAQSAAVLLESLAKNGAQ